MPPRAPLDRLVGVEQEYALCHRPGPGRAHPGNRDLFGSLLVGLSRRLITRPAGGLWGWSRDRVFTQTGGSLYYESFPSAHDAGLVEAATPECRGPSEALRYARAWDHLLADAAKVASAQIGGSLVLRKNGRDAHGHVYGPQESYEVELASGLDLLLWRVGLALLFPVTLVAGLAHLSVVVVMLMVGVTAALTGAILSWIVAKTAAAMGHGPPRFLAEAGNLGLDGLARMERWSMLLLLGPVVSVASLLLRLVAYRPYRRGAEAFLVTRMLISGAGSLEADGSFVLSEKAQAIRRTLRWSFGAEDRGLLETGHLLKSLLGPLLLRPDHALSLFRSRQRLQLGMSDANVCEVADYLKLGTTALVLDLVEAGALDDAPRPADAVRAARDVSRLGPMAPVHLRDGRTVTALDLQHTYAERAATWLAAQPTASLEAHTLVRRWQEVLHHLEHDPEALVGQVDWVTKRALIDEAGDDLDPDEQKAIDLRYHELGDGYGAWLVEEGVIERLVSDAELKRAMRHPPSDTPAAVRGALVRGLSTHEHATIDWRSARVGGRVIHFRRPDSSGNEDDEP